MTEKYKRCVNCMYYNSPLRTCTKGKYIEPHSTCRFWEECAITRTIDAVYLLKLLTDAAELEEKLHRRREAETYRRVIAMIHDMARDADNGN